MFCLSRVTAKTHKLAVRKFKSLKKRKKGELVVSTRLGESYSTFDIP